VQAAPWHNTLPSTLLANTIYELSAWDYTTSREISTSSCSWIIWAWSDLTNFYTTSYFISWGIFRIDNNDYAILHGLNLEWTANWSGWSHTRNYYWAIIRYSDYNIISDITSQHSNRWMYIYATAGNVFNTVTASNNQYWILTATFASWNDNNHFNTVSLLNNASIWLQLEVWDNYLLKNITASNNGNDWIFIENISNATFSWTTTINNNWRHGIYAYISDNITIDWLETYGQTNGTGLRFRYTDNSTINNIVSRNNQNWIEIHSNNSNQENEVANLSSYDNSGYWISLTLVDSIIWNFSSYNNWWNGITINQMNNQTANNIASYNNWWNWVFFQNVNNSNISFSGITNNWGYWFRTYISNTNTYSSLTSSGNNSYWLQLYFSNNNIFTNTTISWNDTGGNSIAWIVVSNSDTNTFRTLNVVDNLYDWIDMAGGSWWNRFENTQIFDNGRYWLSTVWSLSSRFYDDFHVFGNITGAFNWTDGNDNALKAWTDSFLWMSNGVLDLTSY
jgi:hypothetical protein